MIIYVDVYFLINFCVDYIVLQMTCTFFCKKPRLSRLILSSALGGAISVFLFFADSPLLSILILPAASVAMCKAVIEKAGFGQVIVFWCTCIFTGGFLVAVQGIINGGFTFPSATVLILPLCITASALFKKTHRSVKRACMTHSIDAEIYFGDSVARVTLLVDSGNLALEPITGKRIIMLGKNAGRLLSIPDEAEKYPVNLKSATGESHGYAYAPDKIIFNPDTYPEEFLILINSSCDSFAGFDGLVPTLKMR